MGLSRLPRTEVTSIKVFSKNRSLNSLFHGHCRFMGTRSGLNFSLNFFGLIICILLNYQTYPIPWKITSVKVWYDTIMSLLISSLSVVIVGSWGQDVDWNFLYISWDLSYVHYQNIKPNLCHEKSHPKTNYLLLLRYNMVFILS